MAKHKKLTIEQLIGSKVKKEKFMAKEVYIESLDGALLIQKCKYDVVLRAMDKMSGDTTMTDMVEIFKELIYKSVPMFQNGEVLAAYNVVEPFDIVTEILELGEIITVGNEILKLHGFDNLDDEIKN